MVYDFSFLNSYEVHRRRLCARTVLSCRRQPDDVLFGEIEDSCKVDWLKISASDVSVALISLEISRLYIIWHTAKDDKAHRTLCDVSHCARSVSQSFMPSLVSAIAAPRPSESRERRKSVEKRAASKTEQRQMDSRRRRKIDSACQPASRGWMGHRCQGLRSKRHDLPLFVSRNFLYTVGAEKFRETNKTGFIFRLPDHHLCVCNGGGRN